MRVGCGSATIGMFAKQWFGQVDEVVVVDDHITGVLSEHQAGKLLGMRADRPQDEGPPLDSRPLFPGRRARHRLGRHEHLRSAVDPCAFRSEDRQARPDDADGRRRPASMRLLSARRGVCARRRRRCRRRCAPPVERIRENCEPALVHGAVHGRRRRLAARRRHGKSGAADTLGQGRADPRHLRRAPRPTSGPAAASPSWST